MDASARREAIRIMLVQRSGSAPNANAVAEATVDTWHQMAVQLAPVIGARGVDVIFSRALHQTSTTFRWLAIDGGQGDIAARLARLKAHFAGQKAATAIQGSSALLWTFTELLATLIGESLTERLLIPVWNSPASPASEQEIAS